ncbi:MarR family transcriptional regulator [Emticicia sp. CRIBPO]|uniref:MarR family winged helix-turn-helix transcriptional regulator n=1 Tax=Emticicia sp. CRIBPO TaxID=2683258 RepID=UPI0014124505|nr:MarR family transcriptional regulator [Emticicia sp. CRIBPO]NBA88564.1 MarR family transcriptional regulator [Emticicia sp. CRIBPO]
MGLANEIKQTRPFSSKKEEVMVNIMFTNNWIGLNHNQVFKNYDITSQQYNVLRILNGQYPNPITINEIIERMLDKMSNASRLVDKLLLKGLVTRDQRSTNRRACDVIITDEGIELLKIIKEDLMKLERLMVGITDEEAEQLSHLLDKLRNNK